MSRDMFSGHVTAGGDTAILRAAESISAVGRWLLVVMGPSVPVDAHPVAAPLTVGRSTDCDVSLDDGALSRRHLSIVADGVSATVTDHASKNGTFVNGQRIDRAHIGQAAIVRAGETVFRLLRVTDAWEPASPSGPLVGGMAMVPARRTISLVGPTTLPVLIRGETGTGKEVAARLLHGGRGTGSLIAVNCAALPEAVAESELFGHTQGAFTGATRGRKGLFTAAAGGTLFLDEIGELPLTLQAKLLRVVEDGMVRPVGAENSLKVNVRLLAATNRDLAVEVEAGRFRNDLLARLTAVELLLPPLRKRPEDLPALAEYLLTRAGSPRARLSARALEAMALYHWPQNVRELDGILRAALLIDGATIRLEHLPPSLRGRSAEPLLEQRAVAAPDDDAPRARLVRALEKHGGNVRRASLEMGIGRGQVYRWIARWSIDLTTFRGRHDDCYPMGE